MSHRDLCSQRQGWSDWLGTSLSQRLPPDKDKDKVHEKSYLKDYHLKKDKEKVHEKAYTKDYHQIKIKKKYMRNLIPKITTW